MYQTVLYHSVKKIKALEKPFKYLEFVPEACLRSSPELESLDKTRSPFVLCAQNEVIFTGLYLVQ